MIDPRTMPGVLELLPSEQVEFQRMVDSIRSVFERFGFLPIATPAIELSDVLLTKSGGETERQVYFVQSTGSLEQDKAPELALRFDLTVPLARYVAEHQHELVFPFRRYQIQPVFRGESPQRGRFREFYQCDIDVVARDSLSLRYDAEMPAVIDQVFTELGLGPFKIGVNSRKLMRGLLAGLGVEESRRQADILREVDKLARRGEAAVRGGLTAQGHTSGVVDAVLYLADQRGEGCGGSIEALSRLDLSHPLAREAASELETVFETMSTLGVPDEHWGLDLSIARGLDYYTGTVYETTLSEHPEIGSICSGGRYDDLAGLYTSTSLPGVGISIGLTRLYWQLRELGLTSSGGTTVVAYVTLMDDEGIGYSLDVARRLRLEGVNTEAAMEPGKLGRQLRYADRSGIRFVVIAGSDERSRGQVKIKDLRAQSQVEVPIADAAGYINSRI